MRKIFLILFLAGIFGSSVLVTDAVSGDRDTVFTYPQINDYTAFSSGKTPVVSAVYTSTGDGYAIYGYASNASGTFPSGIYGRTESFIGNGVYGVSSNSNTNAGGIGVRGDSHGYNGSGVAGVATNGSSRGVSAYSNGPDGIGLYAIAYGINGIGIYGTCTGANGYAVYSDGKARIAGDLILDGNLIMAESMKIPEYANKSETATVTASSVYNSNYRKENVIDGIINRWDAGEWASLGEKEGAWIQLTWGAPQKISEVWIYDRPNKYDHINDAYLLIDNNGDGTADQTLHLGMFPYGGAPKKIYLTSSEGSSVYAMKLLISEAKESTMNIGLSEIECYYDPNSW